MNPTENEKALQMKKNMQDFWGGAYQANIAAEYRKKATGDYDFFIDGTMKHSKGLD